jgi:peptidoglycan/xylan/chitin deacetylase (PgdA/CDA1 family)
MAWLLNGLAAGFAAGSLAHPPISAGPGKLIAAFVITMVAAAGACRLAPGGWLGRAAGLLAFATAAWLMGWASNPLSGLLAAGLIGLATGTLVQPPPSARAWGVFAGVALASALAVKGIGGGLVAVGVTTCAAAVALAGPAARPPVWRWAGAATAGGLAVIVLAVTSWVGSTSPGVPWFGSLISHGPRDTNMVALTFDDGPNPASLEIMSILDQFGVRATFFSVGKAVEQRPDITAALISHGHVVGNHSFHHDAFRYLDPRYPELARTQQVIYRETGVCPALFRPPHGTHTPFMSRVVRGRGMHLVTWDVSARDWTETDAARLARNILAKARAGSIILLHDGIDGDIPADRSVVIAALPAILAGLRSRGLEPVTLDQLLGLDAYLPPAACATS